MVGHPHGLSEHENDQLLFVSPPMLHTYKQAHQISQDWLNHHACGTLIVWEARDHVMSRRQEPSNVKVIATRLCRSQTGQTTPAHWRMPHVAIVTSSRTLPLPTSQPPVPLPIGIGMASSHHKSTLASLSQYACRTQSNAPCVAHCHCVRLRCASVLVEQRNRFLSHHATANVRKVLCRRKLRISPECTMQFVLVHCATHHVLHNALCKGSSTQA